MSPGWEYWPGVMARWRAPIMMLKWPSQKAAPHILITDEKLRWMILCCFFLLYKTEAELQRNWMLPPYTDCIVCNLNSSWKWNQSLEPGTISHPVFTFNNWLNLNWWEWLNGTTTKGGMVPFVTMTASTLLDNLSTRFWDVSLGMCVLSFRTVLMKSGGDVGQSNSSTINSNIAHKVGSEHFFIIWGGICVALRRRWAGQNKPWWTAL